MSIITQHDLKGREETTEPNCNLNLSAGAKHKQKIGKFFLLSCFYCIYVSSAMWFVLHKCTLAYIVYGWHKHMVWLCHLTKTILKFLFCFFVTVRVMVIFFPIKTMRNGSFCVTNFENNMKESLLLVAKDALNSYLNILDLYRKTLNFKRFCCHFGSGRYPGTLLKNIFHG